MKDYITVIMEDETGTSGVDMTEIKEYINEELTKLEHPLQVRTFSYNDPNNEYFIFEEQEPGIIFLTYKDASPYGMFKWKYKTSNSGSSLSIPSNLPIYYIKKYSEAKTNELFCYFYNTTTCEYVHLVKTSAGGQANYSTDNWVNVSKPQTISGIKTFNALPKSSIMPTEESHFVNKKYVDDKIELIPIHPNAINTVTMTTSGAFILDGMKKGFYKFYLNPTTPYTNSLRLWGKEGQTGTMNLPLENGSFLMIDKDINYDEMADDELLCQVISAINGTCTNIKKKATSPNGITGSTYNSKFVELTGTQTIQGIKYFNIFPIKNDDAMPTNDREFVPKKYVDDEIAKLKAELLGGTTE